MIAFLNVRFIDSAQPTLPQLGRGRVGEFLFAPVKNRDMVTSKITRDQIAEALCMAREWMEKHQQ